MNNTKQNDKVFFKGAIKNDRYTQGMLCTLVFFTLLHCTFAGKFSDDLWFLDMIENADSLWSLLAERYMTWTGRLITEAICFILEELPFAVWSVIDILICLLFYHSLTFILVGNRKSIGNIYVFLGFACYPFMHMASAGWISTSLNYIWPMAMALYVLTGAIRIINGEKPCIVQMILYVLCIIYDANLEMPATYLILLMLGCIGWRFITKNEKKVSFYEITAILICIAGIIFAFTSPGNAVRTVTELRWMPEFPDLNIFDKFRLCAVFVFEHFVAIPDAVFFLFSFLLFLAVLKGNNALWKKILGFIPLLIDIIFTSVYFVNDFLIGHKRAYDYSYPSIYITDGHIAFVQISELAGLFIYIAAVIASLIFIFPDARRRLISIWSLGCGFAVRMSLMLSATMFVSWHRTLIYFYFGMIGCVTLIMKKLYEEDTDAVSETEKSGDNNLAGGKKDITKYMVYAVIVAGILINLFLTIGHQIRIR